MVEYSHARLDETYGALSHHVRRDILSRLRAGEARVTDLAAPFDMTLAAVSKHIRVLEQADLVRRTVVGREHRLALSAPPLREAAGWLAAYREFWRGRLDALESFLADGGRR